MKVYLLIIDKGNKEVFAYENRATAKDEGVRFSMDSGGHVPWTVVAVDRTATLDRMFDLSIEI